MAESVAVISRETAAELERVAKFFGIDLEWNRHIFRHAARVDGRAFETIIHALAVAIKEDPRHGITARVRQAIEKDKKSK